MPIDRPSHGAADQRSRDPLDRTTTTTAQVVQYDDNGTVDHTWLIR